MDQGESLGALLSQGPPTPALAHLRNDARGFAWIPQPDFVKYFAADVDPVKANVMYAVQQPLSLIALGETMVTPPLVEDAALMVPGCQERSGDPSRR